MTHTRQMEESEGEFQNGERPCLNTKCRRCDSKKVTYREWESSCGGYEDTKYTCQDCGHWWWVDGPDA